jgi:hypothetical protein
MGLDSMVRWRVLDKPTANSRSAPWSGVPSILVSSVPAHAITIRRAAEIFGKDEELLWEMATEMEPEHANSPRP